MRDKKAQTMICGKVIIIPYIFLETFFAAVVLTTLDCPQVSLTIFTSKVMKINPFKSHKR